MAIAADPLVAAFEDRARAFTLSHTARAAEGDPLALTQVRVVLRAAALDARPNVQTVD